MKRIIEKIDYSSRFEKQLSKAPLNIKRAWRRRLALFLENFHHPQLRNHLLTGQYQGYRSINITGDWRAIYSETGSANKRTIIFHALGTHSQLYT